jgi:thiamine transporter ThiT
MSAAAASMRAVIGSMSVFGCVQTGGKAAVFAGLLLGLVQSLGLNVFLLISIQLRIKNYELRLTD